MAAGNTPRGIEYPFRDSARMGFWAVSGRPRALSLGASGRLPDVAIGEQDIWNVGGLRTLPIAAAPIVIESTSPNDTPAGSGAGSIHVAGVDGNYQLQEEEVELNGVLSVQTSGAYLRSFPVDITQAGPPVPARNLGVITGTIGGVLQWRMDAQTGHASVASLTVPRGYSGLIRSLTRRYLALDVGEAVNLFWVLRGADGTERRLTALPTTFQDFGQIFDLPLERVPERTDVMLRAERIGAPAAVTPLYGAFGLDLFDTPGLSSPSP